MGTSHWRTNRRLIDVAREEPYRFQLMQAVTVLQRAGAKRIRYQAPLDEGFPSADVEAFRETDTGQWIVESKAISLYGPNGPLPAPVCDAIRIGAREGDQAPRAFLDIFGNRLMELLIDSMRLEVPAAHPASPETTPQGKILQALLTLTAHGGRVGARERALLRSTGLLSAQPRSINAAEHVIARHFGIGVTIRSFEGTWVELHKSEQMLLSSLHSVTKRSRGGLGHHGSLGRKSWVQNAALRVTLGPLSYRLFRDLQPGGRGYETLRYLLLYLLPQEADLILTLVIKAPEVPQAVLSSKAGSALGLFGWLVTKTPDEAKSVSIRLPSRYA